MSVVICVSRTVGAMARWCAIATVFVMLLAGCHSSRDVAQQVESHKILRTIDTLVTVPGGEAQMIADVSVSEGKLTIGSVSATGEGVQLRARIEDQGDGAYSLVVDAEVAEREVAVQVREEITDVRENSSEEHHCDSSGVPLWVVMATTVVLTIIIVINRWTK